MTPESRDATEFPLFPLRAVLFPDGLLGLKVFEARYLDLVARCLRDRSSFGVVGLKRGGEVRRLDRPVAFEAIGTRAELIEVDSAQAGILLVRCRGTERFEVRASRQQDDGLWLAEATAIPGDESVAPPAALSPAAAALADAITALRSQGAEPFLDPHRLHDAGWVANRWCEILPISLAAKQRLLELRNPLVRLEIVDDYLRDKGLVP